MKNSLSILLAITLVLLFLPGTSVAYKENVETNQRRAFDYILLLKSGTRVETIKRPQMQRARTWRGKYIRRQLIKGMNQARELARQGRNDRIPDPAWIFEKFSSKGSLKYCIHTYLFMNGALVTSRIPYCRYR